MVCWVNIANHSEHVLIILEESVDTSIQFTQETLIEHCS